MTIPTVSSAESRKSDRTRQTILDAAALLFRDQGFRATTLRQIAGAAEIKAGSVYYYFTSKDQILDEVMEHGIRVVYDAVETAVSALPECASGRKRLETAMATHLYTLLQYGNYTSANIQNFRHASRAAQDRNRAIRRDYSEYWNGLFQFAQSKGDIGEDIDLSIARLFLLGTLNWTIEWYDPKGDSTDVLAEKFCGLFFEGAAP
jgi:AcrR family transcriptional regulator